MGERLVSLGLLVDKKFRKSKIEKLSHTCSHLTDKLLVLKNQKASANNSLKQTSTQIRIAYYNYYLFITYEINNDEGKSEEGIVCG